MAGPTRPKRTRGARARPFSIAYARAHGSLATSFSCFAVAVVARAPAWDPFALFSYSSSVRCPVARVVSHGANRFRPRPNRRGARGSRDNDHHTAPGDTRAHTRTHVHIAFFSRPCLTRVRARDASVVRRRPLTSAALRLPFFDSARRTGNDARQHINAHARSKPRTGKQPIVGRVLDNVVYTGLVFHTSSILAVASARSFA